MGSSSAVEKTENELQREIDELHRQQRQVISFTFSFIKTTCTFMYS
jgi:hypothetical protein